MTEKKIYIVIGTRAQLIKMDPLMALMQKQDIKYEFIYTAQHKETISRILRDFHVKDPDKTLYNRSEANTIAKFLGWAVNMFLKMLSPKRVFSNKGIVLTHGDTVTTVWAAIAGKLAGCRVVHVESGLRSFNFLKPFPEELMRWITFHFSDIYFCPNDWAVNNLKNYKGHKVNLGANTLYDTVRIALDSNTTIETPSEKFVVVSIHRYENIFTKKLEKKIIPLLEQISNEGFILIFVLHPSTREQLKKNGERLYKRLDKNKRIILKDRYPYFEFIKLLEKSEFVITDGGSNQEELSYLGKPTLLFRESTERIEGLNKNVVISNFNIEKIDKFLKNYENIKFPMKKEEISPSQKIIDYLQTHE